MLILMHFSEDAKIQFIFAYPCGREDMGTSYGTAYSTRSSEEGYGERYGDAVKAVLEKREQKIEMQRGESGDRIETVDSGNSVQLILCSQVHMGSNF